MICVNVDNFLMDGNATLIVFPTYCVHATLQMRESVVMEISNTEDFAEYYTVKADGVVGFVSQNLGNDSLYVRAANGNTLEILYQIRR